MKHNFQIYISPFIWNLIAFNEDFNSCKLHVYNLRRIFFDVKLEFIILFKFHNEDNFLFSFFYCSFVWSDVHSLCVNITTMITWQWSYPPIIHWHRLSQRSLKSHGIFSLLIWKSSDKVCFLGLCKCFIYLYAIQSKQHLPQIIKYHSHTCISLTFKEVMNGTDNKCSDNCLWNLSTFAVLRSGQFCRVSIFRSEYQHGRMLMDLYFNFVLES